MNKQSKSQGSSFSAYYAIAIPMFVLGISGNPAFLAVAFVFFIMAISEEKDEQEQDR
jgi:hypothetical protein